MMSSARPRPPITLAVRNVENELMTRPETLLALLSTGGAGANFSVFRLEMLLFLIAREASDLIGGHHFHFSAGTYGPCEDRLHEDLGLLVENGEILVDEPTSVSVLSVTTKGLQRGSQVLQGLSEEARQAIMDKTHWILSQSAAEVLVRIFDRYPEMAVNSIFRIRRSRYPQPADQCSRIPFVRGMASALDFSGALRNDFSGWTDIEYESEGIASDWNAVGEAFRAVLPMTPAEQTPT